MSLNPKRAVAELKELRELTADENGAQRVAWTNTWLKAREWFASKIKALPVEQHCDAAGNSWVTLQGESEKSLLIGGHLDSVPNGGWLDGALDELAGLEVVRPVAAGVQRRPPGNARPVCCAGSQRSFKAGLRLPCVLWIGPMKKARDLAAACSAPRHSPERILSTPT